MTSTEARLGLRDGSSFVFTCAQCGETAATLTVIDREHPAEPGAGGIEFPTPDALIRQTYVRLEWLAQLTAPVSADLASRLADAAALDPLDFGYENWELGAFCCHRCAKNYCRECWRHRPVFADDYPGWFEETQGVCPAGHTQRLDD